MDLSTLPTDNLYKFLALSGVIIVLASVYMNAKLRIRLWTRYDAILRSQAYIDAQIEGLGAESDSLNRQLQAEKAAGEGASADHVRKIIAKLAAVREGVTRLDARHKATKVDFAASERIRAQLRGLTWLTWAAVVLGLAMAASGFALWYLRVQRYEDQDLRLRASQPPSATQPIPKR